MYGELKDDTLYLQSVFFGSQEDDTVPDEVKTDAEAYADGVIESQFGMPFVLAPLLTGAYPPMIVQIAKMLGSAQVFEVLTSLHIGEGGDVVASPGAILKKEAMALIADFKSGENTLFDAEGVSIDITGATAGPAVNEEEDEDMIFDIRAKPYQYKDPYDAYNETIYNDDDD